MLFPAFSDFLTAMLENVVEGINFFNASFLELCFLPETTILFQFASGITAAGTVLTGIAFTLIVFKFIKKGFETYIVGDGDPETAPSQMLIAFVRALITAVSFQVLWPYAVRLLQEVTLQITNALAIQLSPGNLGAIISNIGGAIMSPLVLFIVAIAFIICYAILYFQFLLRGLELIILRLGFPLACVGIIDADKGIYKNYFTQLVKVSVTSIVQLAVGGLAMLVVGFDIIVGIALIVMTIKTPKFLSEFLLPTGGGGNRISSTMMTINSLKGLIGK